MKDIFSTIFIYCLKVLAVHAKIYGHRVGVHFNIYEKRRFLLEHPCTCQYAA